MVVGGWRDARKGEAEEEVKSMFDQAGFQNMVQETWAPYIRTTFLKITINYAEGPIAAKRQVQTRIVQAMKNLKFQSKVPGSEGAELWCTRQRPVEERHKIRALVMCKEFIEKLGDKASKRYEAPEIDWRGPLYVGNTQLVGSTDRTDAAAEDQFISDNRGNHTCWFLSASAVEKATGLRTSALQETWLQIMGS